MVWRGTLDGASRQHLPHSKACGRGLTVQTTNKLSNDGGQIGRWRTNHALPHNCNGSNDGGGGCYGLWQWWSVSELDSGRITVEEILSVRWTWQCGTTGFDNGYREGDFPGAVRRSRCCKYKTVGAKIYTCQKISASPNADTSSDGAVFCSKCSQEPFFLAQQYFFHHLFKMLLRYVPFSSLRFHFFSSIFGPFSPILLEKCNCLVFFWVTKWNYVFFRKSISCTQLKIKNYLRR